MFRWYMTTMRDGWTSIRGELSAWNIHELRWLLFSSIDWFNPKSLHEKIDESHHFPSIQKTAWNYQEAIRLNLHRRGVRLQCSTSEHETILTFFVNFKKKDILKSEDGKQNGVLLRWKFHEIHLYNQTFDCSMIHQTAAFAEIFPNKSVLKFKVHTIIFRSSSNHYRGFNVLFWR